MGPRRWGCCRSPTSFTSWRTGVSAMTVTHLIDVRSYVDDFNDAVVGAYESNTVDGTLGADAGAARSVIPPGTAALRDFSHLAPTIPEFIADRCVGCMACVSTCPDSALMAVALGKSAVAERLDAFGEGEPVASRARETASAH